MSASNNDDELRKFSKEAVEVMRDFMALPSDKRAVVRRLMIRFLTRNLALSRASRTPPP